MLTQDENRESFRLAFVPEVTCRMEDGEVLSGRLKDISRTGCYLETDTSPNVSGGCEVKVVLNGKESRLTIDRVEADIVRCDQAGIAISFKTPFEWLPLVPIYAAKMKTEQGE